MKPSLICALLGAVAALGVPQTARAQQQPRPPQSIINPDAKIALPAQFDAPQFFDAIAQATKTRIVAPIPNTEQLAQLNQTLGGKTLTLKEIAPLYEQAVGYRFSGSLSDDLIEVRLPDAMIYPMRDLDEREATFLRLLSALSPAQVEQMYLQNGLTVADLTPAQKALYVEARQKNANVEVELREDTTPLTQAQILAQPVRFGFAFRAVALFTDDEALPSLPLFDYGTGLIWDPLVATDTKTFAETFYQQDKDRIASNVGQTHTTSTSSEKARALTFDYPQTRATTVGAALDAIEARLAQKVVFNGGSYARKVRATPVIVAAGRYRADELLAAIGASAGAQLRFYDDVPTLEKRPPQGTISQLPPLVEEAQRKLRRLSLESSGLPFSTERFEGDLVRFSQLFGSEKFALKAKLLNENTEGYDKIDLSKHTFRFANQLYFIANSGGPDTPFVTSSVQLW